MAGPKTNERPGTRAQGRYIRTSVFKVRPVLDLIRGHDVDDALDILALSPQAAAQTVAKILNSAVANAEHNDDQLADELYVSACYADEGPTLRRFRPRARGRATRINKRTSHITIIVSRHRAEDLEKREAAEASITGSRARRIQAQREADAIRAAEALTDEVDEADEGTTPEEAATDEAVTDDTATDEAVTDEPAADEPAADETKDEA